MSFPVALISFVVVVILFLACLCEVLSLSRLRCLILIGCRLIVKYKIKEKSPGFLVRGIRCRSVHQLPSLRTRRADPALDRLGGRQRPVTLPTSAFVVINQPDRPEVFNLLQNANQGVVLLGLVSLPQKHPAVILNESDPQIVGFVVRTDQERQNPLAWGEFRVGRLGFDPECPVSPACGVFDSDDPVVGLDREVIDDFNGFDGFDFCDHAFHVWVLKEKGKWKSRSPSRLGA